MMLARAMLLAAVVLALGVAWDADATHFRGGGLSLEATGANQAELDGWLAYRTDYPWGTTPTKGKVIDVLVGPVRYSDGTDSASNVHVRVVDLDPSGNWFSGAVVDASGKRFKHTFPSADDSGDPWYAGFYNAARLGESSGHMNNGGSGVSVPPDGTAFYYSLIASIDFTGAARSPIGQTEPIVSCEKGKLCQFTPPIIDPDGDTLTYGLSTPEEAGFDTRFRQPGHDPAHGTSKLAINTAGTVSWDTKGAKLHPSAPTYYSVQVRAADQDSSIPMDFFIELVDPYVDPPYWTASPCGTTRNLVAGVKDAFTATAKSDNAARKITVNHLGLPGGSTIGIGAPNNPVAANFAWTPDVADEGIHQVVFRAVDDIRQRAPLCQVGLNVVVKPPEARDDGFAIVEDSGANDHDVLGNDVDLAGRTIKLVAVTTGALGGVSIQGSQLRYVPDADAYGTDCVEYTIEAGDDQDSGEACFIIAPKNDKPSFAGGPDFLDLKEDLASVSTPWAKSISTGPANEAGQAITWLISTDNPGLFGTLNIDQDGLLTFDGAKDAFGEATVTVRMRDSGGTSDGGIDTSDAHDFVVKIAPVNDPPTFTVGSDITVLEDSAAASQAVATDVSAGGGDDEDGQTVTWTYYVDQPLLFAAGPTLSDAGVLSFTPAPEAHGTTVLHLQLTDSEGATSDEKTLEIEILNVNDAPSWTPGDDLALWEGEPPTETRVSGWATEISVGPDNEDGQVPIFDVVAEHPSRFFDGPRVTAGGTLVYTLEPKGWGVTSLKVCLRDDGGTANGGMDTGGCHTVAMDIRSINDRPTFTPGADLFLLEDDPAYSEEWASAISAGPEDEIWQDYWFVLTPENPAMFSAGPLLSREGVLSFTLARDASGSANIKVVLVDDGGTENGGLNRSLPWQLTIEIVPRDDAPVARPDTYDAVEETMLSVAAPGVMANDVEPDGEPIKATVLLEPAFGELNFNADGSFTYEPDTDYFGADSFRYEIQDIQGTRAAATVTIHIANTNDAPIGQPDYYLASPDVTLRVEAPVGILANDIDKDRDALLAILISPTTQGWLNFRDDGSFDYTPAPGYTGTDLFVYRAIDESGGSSIASNVHIRVGQNVGPVADFDVLQGRPIANFATKFEDRSVDGDGFGLGQLDANTEASVRLSTWFWEFGDGYVSHSRIPTFWWDEERNIPVDESDVTPADIDGTSDRTVAEHVGHIFKEPGTYTVRLTVTDDDGAFDRIEKSVTIYAAGAAESRMSAGDNMEVLEGRVVQLVGVGNASATKWVQMEGDLVHLVQGEVGQAIFQAPRLTGRTEELQLTFSLTGSANGVALQPDTMIVTVLRDPLLTHIYAGEDQVVEEGETIFLSATYETSTGTFAIHWEQVGGDALGIGQLSGTSVTVAAPSGKSGSTFVFRAWMTDIDPSKPQDSDDGTILLDKVSSDRVAFDDVQVTVFAPVRDGGFSFDLSPTGEVLFVGPIGKDHAWSFGEGNTSSIKDPIQKFAPGSYDVSVQVTDDLGRVLRFRQTVVVEPEAEEVVVAEEDGYSRIAVALIVGGSMVTLGVVSMLAKKSLKRKG